MLVEWVLICGLLSGSSSFLSICVFLYTYKLTYTFTQIFYNNQIKLPVAKMLLGSTVFFKPFINSTPVYPILLGKNFFLNFILPMLFYNPSPY